MLSLFGYRLRKTEDGNNLDFEYLLKYFEYLLKYFKKIYLY
jgi:hypothetical protein